VSFAGTGNGLVRKQYHFWPGEHGLDAWDVDRLIVLARQLPVEEVELADLSEIDTVYWFDDVHRPTVREVVAHIRLVRDVDGSYPVILGPNNRVMDGMHRVARALLEGQSTIRAVRLGEARARLPKLPTGGLAVLSAAWPAVEGSLDPLGRVVLGQVPT